MPVNLCLLQRRHIKQILCCCWAKLYIRSVVSVTGWCFIVVYLNGKTCQKNLFLHINFFSNTWEILQDRVGCFLHSASKARWSARVESVRPFAAHQPGLKVALNRLKELNLTSLTNGRSIRDWAVLRYIWLPTDVIYMDQSPFREQPWNVLLQARQATLDVEIVNLCHLINNLTSLCSKWDDIVQ